MANPEHLAILKEGVKVWNEWRMANPAEIPDLSGADLPEADLRDALLSGSAEFFVDSGDYLDPVVISNEMITEMPEFGLHELYRSFFDGADMQRINLKGAKLNRACLAHADLTSANLQGADLRGAMLDYAKLDRADLRHAVLINHSLSGVSFRNAKLYMANLTHSDLVHADFTGADLKWSYFTSTNLQYAKFNNANLEDANLDSAVLYKTELDGANLHHTRLNATLLVDVDLSKAHGLEEIIHNGPSAVGIGTISCSVGRVPEDFWRNLQLPEEWLDIIFNWPQTEEHGNKKQGSV